MSIRENVSRVLFFALFLAMLIAPVGYTAADAQIANHNDAKFTLFQAEETDRQPVAAIACNVNDETSSGGCGG